MRKLPPSKLTELARRLILLSTFAICVAVFSLLGQVPVHAAAPPPLATYTTTHSMPVPDSECSALRRRGYSSNACVITFTAVIKVQPVPVSTVPLNTCGGTLWATYEMISNQGPIWGVEQDGIYGSNLCAVFYESGSKACYTQYSAPGTSVTNTNCNAGNTPPDAFGNSTFSITTFGVIQATEVMSETITPQNALHPTYNCRPSSCTS